MRVANGPASTQVKSTTRRPSSGFPAVVEPRWRRPSARGASPPPPHRASTSSIDDGLCWRGWRWRGLLLRDAAAGESGERAGHAHVRVALDRAKRPAVLVLRIRRHLSDGLDLTEGDVTALCLGEEFARVHGEREPFDGRHDPRHLTEHLLGRQRSELGTFLVARLGHPLEERRRVGGGGDVARTGPGVGHDVRTEPVQRSLTQRTLRKRQEIGEPPLEEQVLERRGDRLVQRQVDVLSGSGLASIPHAGEPADGRHERAEVHVLASPRVDGVVGRARHAQHATERPGHEVLGLPVGARSGAAERGERDLDEPRVHLDERIVIQAQLGEPPGRRRFDHQIGALGQPSIGAPACLARQVVDDDVLAAVEPPIQQTTTCGDGRVGHRRPTEGRTETDDRSPGFGQHLAGQTRIVAGHLDDT